MMLRMRNLNYEEEKAIKELEMRMKNDITPRMRDDPSLFYRFLKARDFNLDNAEKMMRNHITWRKVFKIDNILKDFKPKEFFQKYLEPPLIGCDKDGDMVLYSGVGKFNMNEIFKCVKMGDGLKDWFWFGERYSHLLNEQSKKEGTINSQISLILDLDELTIGNAFSKYTVTLFVHFAHAYQDNYPERMKSVFVINAPSYTTFVWTILKHILANVVIQKIHIYGRNGWKEKLLERIDANILPAFLGGNRTDPDGNPMCKTFITFFAPVPQKYFLTTEERYFKDSARVERLTVPNSAKKEISVDVEEAGLILEWEFLVNGKDIGFGLSFEVSEEETQTVIPVYKYNTFDGTEKDFHKCHSSGKYIIIFDNSFSRLNSKEVQYCITIVAAKD